MSKNSTLLFFLIAIGAVLAFAFRKPKGPTGGPPSGGGGAGPAPTAGVLPTPTVGSGAASILNAGTGLFRAISDAFRNPGTANSAVFVQPPSVLNTTVPRTNPTPPSSTAVLNSGFDFGPELIGAVENWV